MSWIKVEHSTPDKTEIMRIAADCGVSRGEAFLAWFRLFSWADTQTDTGRVPFMSRSMGDTIGTLPGLCDSLVSTGWLVFDDDGMTIANWHRHNGRGTKSRLIEAEKKARQRAKKRDTRPQTTGTNVHHEAGQPRDQIREDKSRREYNTPPPPRGGRPTDGNGVDAAKTWDQENQDGSPGHGHRPHPPCSMQAAAAAKAYLDILSKAVGAKFGEPDYVRWGRYVDRLQGEHGVGIPQIVEALQWAGDNRAQDGVPEINRPVEIVTKWIALQGAMKRAGLVWNDDDPPEATATDREQEPQ